MCVNVHQSCCNTLIREERNTLDKETKERIENLKDQVIAKQKHQVSQLQTLKINNNKLTAEINEKQNENSKLNQRMIMLKEELTRVKEKLHKAENVSNYRTDKRELLKKR